MKKMKKIFALLIAMVMVFGLSTMASASEATNDGKITVTPPANTLADSENTYTLYKVFAATTDGSSYSYRLSGEHTTVPAGFILDDAGNVFFADIVTAEDTGTFKTKVNGATVILKNKTALTDTDIANIANYVTDADQVGDPITVTGRTAAVFDNLAYGYYYVKTTTGALVVIDSTKPAVDIVDKNTVPELDKKAKQAADPTYMEIDEAGHNAIAQVGTVVPYEATITVGKGAIGYVFHDTMGAGLAYNDDVKVFNGTTEVTAGTTTYSKTPVGTDTITITFVDDYTKALAEGTVLTIKYSATITSNALSVNPATNTASLDYGHEDGQNSVPDVPVHVYNAKLTVTKKDEKGDPLAGAGFVLKNAQGKYYKLTETTTGTGDDAVTTYSVSWVDTVGAATEYTTTTGTDGNVIAFTGLGKGKYTLVENTVPAGYNPAADEEFEVKADNFESLNLELTADVINNKGAELPSTGGIGTTIFYIIGAILVVGAGVVLVTRRRMKK